MSYSRDEFAELAAGYSINALTDEELTRFRELLSMAPPEDLEIVADFWEAALQLPATHDEMAPSPKVKKALMRKIRGDVEVIQSKKSFADHFKIDSPIWAIGIPVVLAVIAISSLNEVRKTKIEQKKLALQNINLIQERQKNQELVEFLANKNLKVREMKGLDPSPNAEAQLIWNSETKEAIVRYKNLPPPPSDKDYQLWVIKDGKPISAAVFSFVTKKEDGDYIKIAYFNEDDYKGFEVLAITLEPKGGVPSPTGPMFVKSGA